MDDDASPIAAEPIRIPNAWRAMRTLKSVFDMLEQNPDLVGDDIALALDSEVPEFGTLIDAFVASIQDREDISAARKIRAARVAALGKRDEEAAEKLRSLLADVMVQAGLKNYRATSAPVSLIERDGKVNITDEDLVPKRFKTTVVTTVIDKRAIAKEFKERRSVPGAEQGNSYHTVTIKG